MFTHTKKKIKIHFIGIGGIGMSGIAEVLISLDYKVSGSDISHSNALEKLTSLGAEIFVGHKYENPKGATVVVYSSAVKDDNPEMIYAKEHNIPIMRRAEMLAELMKLKHGIAVAGTHGKTTTTSMLATILENCGANPTYIIGGVVANLQGHARIGSGNYLVAEADESDGSFLLLNPIMSVITNIDNDHIDHYKNEENLFQAFLEFANKAPFYGVCMLNAHDSNLMKIKDLMKRPAMVFGIGDRANEKLNTHIDYEAREIHHASSGVSYKLYYKGDFHVEIKLRLPGEHNVLNSLGAISLAHFLGFDFASIQKALFKYEGTGRRYQTLYKNDKFEIIDDYGHHPTEINQTIKATRTIRKDTKVTVIFEPHRYTRTRDCWNQFFHCFNEADQLYLGPIYAASERPIDGIESERLVIDINKVHPQFASYLPSMDQLTQLIKKLSNEEQVYHTILVLGAGSIGKRIRETVETLWGKTF